MILKEKAALSDDQYEMRQAFSGIIVARRKFWEHFTISPRDQVKRTMGLADKALKEVRGQNIGIVHVFGRDLENHYGDYRGTQFYTQDLSDENAVLRIIALSENLWASLHGNSRNMAHYLDKLTDSRDRRRVI